MNNLSTKVGDKGTTKTFAGGTISKGDQSIFALGYGDLLNCYVGKSRFLLGTRNTELFPISLDHMIQKNISMIMGHISYGDVMPSGNISSECLEKIDEMNNYIRNHTFLKQHKMNDWLFYEGNAAQIASKYARIFEHAFIKWINETDNDHSSFSEEIKFLNRLSDYLFYLGLYYQLQFERNIYNETPFED